jgi:hypothetical protein
MPHKKFVIKLSQRFIDDLYVTHKTEVKSKQIYKLPKQFLKELDGTYYSDYNIDRERTIDELNCLSDSMNTLRENCTKDVWEKVNIIKERDPEDPLFCPVSLLGTMDYGHLEIAHTRTLAWLLNSEKPHGFDHALSELFIRRIFKKMNKRFYPLQINRVESEKRFGKGTPEGKRADIWIEGKWRGGPDKNKEFLFVIEAKINAVEGERQLSHYDKILETNKKAGGIYKIFITTTGRKPLTTKKYWTRISFLEICEIFRKVLPTLKEKPGFHFLRYYIAGVLKDILKWPLPIEPKDGKVYEVYEVYEFLSKF